MLAAPIILFDGVCNLCNGAVQFVIRHDQKKQFHFASLQSAAGQELLKKHALPLTGFNSFVLVEGETAYTGSTAALRVAKKLSGGWKMIYGFIIVPKFMRDWVYRFIAKNRYKWFGERESCMIPTKELRGRFLD